MSGELTESELYEHINSLEAEIKEVSQRNAQLTGSMSAFSGSQDKGNLINLQLQTQDLLERLERFYRGDYLTSEEGNFIWKSPKDDELKPFNDFGVNLLMETISKYIDKNTILSNYKEERIFEILGDLGDELILVIYCNYEKMGMNTYFKKTKFRLIISTTLHMIESVYRRAIEGKSSEELNQSRIVTQSDSLGRPMPMAPMRKKSLFSWR